MLIDYDALHILNPAADQGGRADLCVNVVGDWAPVSGNTSEIVRRGQEAYYGVVGEYFRDGDLNIVNVESVLDDNPLPLSKLPPRFIDSEALAGSLRSIRTHLACLANNHIFDNGPAGLEKTRQALAGASIASIGADFGRERIYSPFCFQKGETRLAILNIADGVEANEKYHNGIGAADLESYRVVEWIKALKQEGHTVILIVHAGVVFMPAPPPFLQRLYREFIDLGADMVIGHHPHVVQGCEIYQGRPIFHSIGQFGIHRRASRPQERQGLLLRLYFSAGAVTRVELVPFAMEREGLRRLLPAEQDAFRREFRQLGALLEDEAALERLWRLYVAHRHPVISCRRIVQEYRYDAGRSHAFSRGQAISYVNRFLLAAYGDCAGAWADPASLELLRRYGLFRKYRPCERIFLAQREMLAPFRKMKSAVVHFLRRLKRSILG